ncbi:MAG: methyltransferase domain-containing protein [Methylococcaceae bacterium]|jgi:SAM-dependent methyltransferase
MLEDCLELGLVIKVGDAVDYLSMLSSESVVLISAFHVVEHISFERLRVLISEALRVLKPGGMLIMETPNPENLVVATRSFYIDPTHLKPIPPELLSFIPEYCGFKRIKTIRLNEAKSFSMPEEEPSLRDVFHSVSPDYAVVAQKAAPLVMEANALDFKPDTGICLETLIDRYDQVIQLRIAESSKKAEHAERKAQEAEMKAQEAENGVRRAQAKPRKCLS